MDPIIASLMFPFACCFEKWGIFSRPKILEKCEEKFNSELEITTLLGKIRDSHDMLKNLQDKKFQTLLKYGKDRIINLDDSGSNSDPDKENASDEDMHDEYLFSDDETIDNK